jgi:hypothetical protein
MTCNPLEEIQRIETLFEMETVYYDYKEYSLKEYIDKLCFRILPISGTSLGIDDLKNRLGINATDSIDGLLSYCEFVFNIVYQSSDPIRKAGEKDAFFQVVTISKNINLVLEKLNHEIIEQDNKRLIVVEKNKAAAQAASLIDDPKKALKVIEYNHIALKGDLLGKQSILKQLGDVVEPILKSHVLRDNGYAKLEDDAGFLLNNCQIRHENKEGNNQKEFIADIDDNDLEELYDMAYQTLLMVIIANEQIGISEMVDSLKKQYKW